MFKIIAPLFKTIFRKVSFSALLNFLLVISFANAAVIDRIRDQGRVKCGSRDDLQGFSAVDEKGNPYGLDVDFCKAIAAAVLGSAQKTLLISLGVRTRFSALASDDIDVLIRNTTWTYGRDTSLGFDFAGTIYYDGQGFLTKRNYNATRFEDLPGDLKICVAKNTTSIENVKRFLTNQTKNYPLITFNDSDSARAGFLAGRCEIFTTDASALVAIQFSFIANPSDYLILDNIISKEPLGILVRENDSKWRDLVRWVLYATIEAEEKGISSDNIDLLAKESKDPAIQYLLGNKPGIGKPLGLDDKWFYRVIKQIGNYGEIFERNLGKSSPLNLSRGLNALWTNGGLIYSPPFR